MIVPIDVAVCDPDLMWRVDHMNAARAVNVREFGTVLDAAEELTAGHEAVILVGPNGIDLAVADLSAVTTEHPEWKAAFVVDRGDDDLVDRVMQAGASLVIDRADDPLAVAERALTLLPTDRTSVAADEAEAEARQDEERQTRNMLTSDLVIVTSAKGGEGVTTVAANLARSLASNGVWRVALVEADPLFGDLTLLLDLPESVHYDVRKIRVFDQDVVARLTVLEPESGVKIVRPPLGWSQGELPVDFAVDLVNAVGADVDVVVVDAPLSLVRNREFALLASAVLLVTTRKTASMKNALLAARVLGRPPNLRLVINETGRHQGEDPSQQAQDALGVMVIGSLPYEGKLDRSGATLAPHVLSPARSHFSRDIEQLAVELRTTLFGGRRRAAVFDKLR